MIKKTNIFWTFLFAAVFVSCNVIILLLSPSLSGKYAVAFVLGNLLLLAAMAYLIGFYQLTKRILAADKEKIQSYYRLSYWLLGGLLFLVPFFLMIHVPDSYHNWDFFQLYRNISTLKGQSFSLLPFDQHYGDLSGLHYYLTYPNQQFFAILLNVTVGKLASVIQPIWSMTFLSALMTAASVLATSHIVKLLADKRLALIFNLAAFGFGPFYVYGALLYTDTASMPFVIFGLLLMLLALRADGFLKQVIYWLLATLIIFLGYQIKPTVAIILIAALIFLTLNKKWQTLALVLILSAVSFVATDLAAKAVIASQPAFSVSANNRYNLPLIHWVAMSFAPDNQTGGYNHAVLIYSMSFATKAAKSAADMHLLTHNFLSEGPLGILRQLARKIAYTWLNGDLNDFFYSNRHALSFIQQYFDYTSWAPATQRGNITGWLFTRAAQMLYWMALVPLMFVSIFKILRREWRTEWFILALSVVGLTGFLLIWEANSRYLYNFTPIMIALAVKVFVDFLSRTKEGKV